MICGLSPLRGDNHKARTTKNGIAGLSPLRGDNSAQLFRLHDFHGLSPLRGDNEFTVVDTSVVCGLSPLRGDNTQYFQRFLGFVQSFFGKSQKNIVHTDVLIKDKHPSSIVFEFANTMLHKILKFYWVLDNGNTSNVAACNHCVFSLIFLKAYNVRTCFYHVLN